MERERTEAWILEGRRERRVFGWFVAGKVTYMLEWMAQEDGRWLM
jgi:hypothetical protein